MSNPTKNNSNNALVIGVVAAIVVAGVFVVMMLNQPKNTANNQGTPSASPDSPSKEPVKETDNNSVKEGNVSIEIKSFAFNPATITVKKGTKVTWTNKDDAHHDITPDDESPKFTGSGKLLAQGEEYSFTFNEVGTYKYHCSPHPYMKATIEVVE